MTYISGKESEADGNRGGSHGLEEANKLNVTCDPFLTLDLNQLVAKKFKNCQEDSLLQAKIGSQTPPTLFGFFFFFCINHLIKELHLLVKSSYSE